MANSFPASGLAYADAFSVGTANAAASSLYVCSACTQAVRIEQTYAQSNLHHNTLWLRQLNCNGTRQGASIGFTVSNNGGDHHRANIEATANSGQIGGNLALYTRNNNGNDQLGYFQDHAGNVGIGTTDFTNVAFGSPAIHAAGNRATLGLSSTGTLSTIAFTAGNCSQTALHINHSDEGTTSFYNYRYGGQAFVFTGLGRLGVNTTSPSTPLQIRSNTIDSGGAGLSVFGYDGAVEFTTTRAESPANAAIYLYNRPTSGTNGTGTGISFRASSTNTADRPQGGFYSSWTDSTDATRTSKFFFDLVNSGTYATRMTLLGSGALGLGTTSPASRLHINHTGAQGACTIILQSTDSCGNGTISWRTSAGVTQAQIGSNYNVGDNGGNLELITSAATRLLVTSGGLVSINQTSGYGVFNVTGINCAWGEGIVLNPAPNGYSAINFRAEGRTGSCFIATWQLGKISSGETSSGEAFSLNRAGLTGGTAYRADASQQWKTNGDSIFGFNVGIGTTSPSQRLHVTGRAIISNGTGTNESLSVGTTSSSTGTNFGTIDVNGLDYSAYYLRTNDTIRFSIFQSGGVTAVNTITNIPLTLGTCDTERMRITNAGNVGINTSSPSYRLHVNGTFYAAGSSIKYKEGICNYDTDSCLFMCLKPVAYQYKDEFKHLGKELKSDIQIGLIAEHVAEVMPELAVLVNEEDEKVVRNVDYEKLSIVLLAEVQKLRKEVDELKK